MAGDDPSDAGHAKDVKGEFLSQPRWKRFVIVIMGPVMNVLLAVALLTGLYKFHFERPSYLDQAATVGDVDPGSPAAKANIQVGDVIVGFGNKANPRWEDIVEKTLLGANELFPVDIDHNGEIQKTSIKVVSKGSEQAGYVGWNPVWRGFLGDVDTGFTVKPGGFKGRR